jgi:hypothetical protein
MKTMRNMRTKGFFALVIIVSIIVSLFLFTFNAYAEEDNKQVSGYYTTDMWLLGITPYKPVSLNHTIIPGTLSQSEIRSLASLGYHFAYVSDEYDVVIFDPLVIVVFYINGFSSNIICLGDAVSAQ